jgi:hypothetical protein
METNMSQMDAMLWLSVVMEAQKGNPESINLLQAENKLRAEQNRPSVEEELIRFARRSEDEKK